MDKAKIGMLMFPLISILGCSYYIYHTELYQVRNPGFGRQEIRRTKAGGGIFEDALMRAEWSSGGLSSRFPLKLTLTNKTEYGFAIVWRYALYIDNHGRSYGIGLLEGTKFENPPDMEVILSSKSDHYIFPADYLSPFDSPGIGLLRPPDEIFQILLPLAVEDTLYEYVFIFKTTEELRR